MSPTDPPNLPRGWPCGTETVLLAEDDAAVRDLVRFVLAGCGYAVVVAADGWEAELAAAGLDGPLDLLVTDVVMPGLFGPELARRVTARHPAVKVLYLSGFPDATLPAGAEVLPKPFRQVGLAGTVRAILDGTAGSRCGRPHRGGFLPPFLPDCYRHLLL